MLSLTGFLVLGGSSKKLVSLLQLWFQIELIGRGAGGALLVSCALLRASWMLLATVFGDLSHVWGKKKANRQMLQI